MAAYVEAGLMERFAIPPGELDKLAGGSNQAWRSAGPQSFTSESDWESVRKCLGESQLDGEPGLIDFLAVMNMHLPPALWHCAVLSCTDARARESVRAQLTRWGFPITPPSNVNAYLDALGFVAVAAPPHPGALEWLTRLTGVEIIGDGDRPVGPPEPLTAVDAPSVGPNEAMRRSMLLGGSLPEDLDGIAPGSVRVAVVDTGVDDSLPGLQGQVEAHFDFSDSQVGPVDPVGHGTHVAGIIAGTRVPAAPSFEGVASKAQIVDIQVWDPAGTNAIMMLAGLGCAIEQRVDILNLSMGTDSIPADGTSILSRAIEEVVSRGIVACVSAGNSGEYGRGTISTPSDAPSALSVAAVHLDGSRAQFSSMGPSADPDFTGPKPNISAPGVNIVSVRSTASARPVFGGHEGYTAMSGTSMASPMVAGLCALGVAYARSKGASELDAREAGSRLLASAANPASQEPYEVGVGIPQARPFLHAMCASGQAGGGVSKTKSGNGCSSDMSNQGEVRSSGETERPALLRDTTENAAHYYCELERTYLDGVTSNVKRFTGGLVDELVGIRAAKAGDPVLDDESQSISDAALMLDSDIGALTEFPSNGCVWIPITAGLTRKPVLCVCAKSFCGWSLLSQINSGDGFQERILAFNGSLKSRCVHALGRRFENVPIALSLFSPDGWHELPETLGLISEARFVYPCMLSAESTIHIDIRNCRGSVGWHTWVSLTPATVEKRLEQYGQDLLNRLEAFPTNGLLEISTIAAAWNMSSEAAEEFVLRVAKSGLPVCLKRASDGTRCAVLIR